MRVLIHASNFTGLGAVEILNSLLTPLIRRLAPHRVCLVLPRGESLKVSEEALGVEVVRVKRFLPNAASRVLECLVPDRRWKDANRFLVLGDLPLGGIGNQVVMVHQPNLVSPRVNRYASNAPRYRVMRRLFSRNLRFAGTLVVQTGVMKQQLMASYPLTESRVRILPQPAPAWFGFRKKRTSPDLKGPLRLFYPAFLYPHKNHRILEKMACGMDRLHGEAYLIVTISPKELPLRLHQAEWLSAVGRLTPDDCLAQYRQTDALFFPSVLESYGLPLVEAMSAGLPVLCADLPYARCLCGEEGIYFDPENGDSAVEAIGELRRRIRDGWFPDWTAPLARLPADWKEVAHSMAGFLGL